MSGRRCAGTHEVIAPELAAAFVGDAGVLPDLLDQLPFEKPVASVAADGPTGRRAYETHATPAITALLELQATTLILSRTGAVAWPPLADGQPYPRTAILEVIEQ